MFKHFKSYHIKNIVIGALYVTYETFIIYVAFRNTNNRNMLENFVVRNVNVSYKTY